VPGKTGNGRTHNGASVASMDESSEIGDGFTSYLLRFVPLNRAWHESGDMSFPVPRMRTWAGSHRHKAIPLGLGW